MNIGLKQAGHVLFVLSMPHKDANAAKDEWARITGHLDPCWDSVKKTYYGWPVIVTNAKALSRSETKTSFYY